jgi:hypothetical protein
VAAAKTRLAQEVTDGKLTQAEADTLAANLTTRVTQAVNATSARTPSTAKRAVKRH